MLKNHVFHRIAYLVPALFLYSFAYLFNIDNESINLHLHLAGLIKVIATVYIIISVALIISALLNCLHDRYKNLEIAKLKPIKSYLQVVKIILFTAAGVLAVSALLEKSPLYFFTSIGALTAVLMVIFKDSILGFIASIQLSAYDMIRIGDWIEMPAFGADGEVVDILLNTVKVQNFDKTIITIPSYALLTSGLKNWRGMQEAGGRRIKRFINVDITSIKICDNQLLEHLKKSDLLKEIKNLDEEKLTNLGLFRHFLEIYLKQHPSVRKDMKILIRHLQETATGLPLELYFFTNEIDSEKYEVIQADIFEYIYATLPKFGLRVFQYSTNTD